MFILNNNSKEKKIWLSVLVLILISSGVLTIMLNKMNYISGNIRTQVIFYMLFNVLIIPIYLVFNLFMACVISIIIIIINNKFSFRRLYISLIYYNSINLFVTSVGTIIIEWPKFTTPILVISYFVNMVIIYLQKESFKKYASVSNIAATVVMVLQMLLITSFSFGVNFL